MNPQPETLLVITGAAGVLGRMVVEEARNRDDSEHMLVIPMTRETWDFQHGMIAPTILFTPMKKVLINCAGVIREVGSYSPKAMSYINAALPHELASTLSNGRVVQISTDCVFSGDDGPYDEEAQPTPVDMYGKTKLAGELTGPMYDRRNVLTIRLSFIGLGRRGWLRRFMYAKPEVPLWGFDSWRWNGLYARTAARTILDWALNDSMTGVVHLEGPVTTKYHLYEMLVDRFRPEMDLRKTTPSTKNMILSSRTAANAPYEYHWGEMLNELEVDWHERWSVDQGWRED